MATYAVGDIQGCLKPLKKLLRKMNFCSGIDVLWVAGDLVNRGPHSLETLEFIHDLGESAIIVLGNHDLHLLALAETDSQPRPKDTLDPILYSSKGQTLLSWLCKQPLIHHDAELKYTMVHAGIPPIWTIDEALDYADEVHEVLRSKQRITFFKGMYGNLPDVWDEKLDGIDRLRMITNYLTRMRYCDKRGRLELKTKTNEDTAPEGFAAWFDHKKHACKKDNIIFGHWAALMGQTDKKNFVALDTGCVWGGCLTAMRLEDGKKFHVDCSD